MAPNGTQCEHNSSPKASYFIKFHRISSIFIEFHRLAASPAASIQQPPASSQHPAARSQQPGRGPAAGAKP
jgi:hypothetical protein